MSPADRRPALTEHLTRMRSSDLQIDQQDQIKEKEFSQLYVINIASLFFIWLNHAFIVFNFLRFNFDQFSYHSTLNLTSWQSDLVKEDLTRLRFSDI